MLDNLFNDIINDVVALRKSTSIKETHTLTESEESECRRRITPILKQIEGGGLSIWNTWMSISSNSPLLLRRKALWLSPPPVGR